MLLKTLFTFTVKLGVLLAGTQRRPLAPVCVSNLHQESGVVTHRPDSNLIRGYRQVGIPETGVLCTRDDVWRDRILTSSRRVRR